MVNNAMLNCLKLLKAGILRTFCLTPLDFFNVYKFGLKVNKKLVKKWKFIYYSSKNYKLLVLVLIIKIKEKESILKPVTPVPLLLLFKKIKNLNIKMLYNSFLFKKKYLKLKMKTLSLMNLRL